MPMGVKVLISPSIVVISPKRIKMGRMQDLLSVHYSH